MTGKLISLSTMREIEVPRVQVGQCIRYHGDMANASGVGAVVAVRTDGRYPMYDVALTDGREIRGTYLESTHRYEISGEVLNADQINVLRAGVAAKVATDSAKATADAQAFRDAVENLKAAHPHLTQGSGCVVAAKNIRTELKRAFPSVKFSVRSESYSGGNAVRISWADGPTSEQVEKITDKYSGGSFDGMTDCYNYRRSPWTEVFGEAKYVTQSRHNSDAAILSAARRTKAKLGGIAESVDEIAAAYKKGAVYQIKQSGGCDVERHLNMAISRHTYCLNSKAA